MIIIVIVIVIVVVVVVVVVVVQPLTIKYLQDDLCIFRVSLVSAVCYTVLKIGCHTHLAMAKPRTTSQEARPKQIKVRI